MALGYGYFDETGDVAPFSGSRYFIVAGYVTTNPRPVELLVQRARKSLGRQARLSEIKSANTLMAVQERLLQALAKEEVDVFATVLDKRALLKPPADLEDIYRWGVARTLGHVVERWPHLSFYLDKRYTTKALFDKLELHLRNTLTAAPQQAVLIRPVDSQQSKGLQAADFVAGAFRQKWELDAAQLWAILQPRIVVEEVVTPTVWGK